MAGIRELCAHGRTDVPVYDISANARVSHRIQEITDADCLVAEGIFAAELVKTCKSEGLLSAAICVRRWRLVTFVLRPHT